MIVISHETGLGIWQCRQGFLTQPHSPGSLIEAETGHELSTLDFLAAGLHPRAGRESYRAPEETGLSLALCHLLCILRVKASLRSAQILDGG